MAAQEKQTRRPESNDPRRAAKRRRLALAFVLTITVGYGAFAYGFVRYVTVAPSKGATQVASKPRQGNLAERFLSDAASLDAESYRQAAIQWEQQRKEADEAEQSRLNTTRRRLSAVWNEKIRIAEEQLQEQLVESDPPAEGSVLWDAQKRLEDIKADRPQR